MTCLPAGVGASIIVLLFAPVGLPWLAWLMSVGLDALVGKKGTTGDKGSPLGFPFSNADFNP